MNETLITDHVAVVANRNLTQRTGWAMDELARVLDRLTPTDVQLRLDPGVPLHAAEISVLSGWHTMLWPLLPPDRILEWFDSHSCGHRLANLMRNDHVEMRTSDSYGTSVPVRRHRDEGLAALCDTHIIIHDGRPRGSTFAYLNLVMGLSDVILIDPERAVTSRLLTYKENSDAILEPVQ